MTQVRVTNWIEDIRNYMRDKPRLNTLLADEETHNTTATLCIELAIDYINSTPPIGVSTITTSVSGNITLITYPTNMRQILLEACIVEILKSVIFLRSRNRLPYSTGSVSVNEQEGPLASYLQLLQMLQSSVELKLRRFKLAANMEQIMDSGGGLGSDYSFFYNYDTWNYEGA
jgi:hypothetical protein